MEKKISSWHRHPASSIFVLVLHIAESWSLLLKLPALEAGKKTPIRSNHQNKSVWHNGAYEDYAVLLCVNLQLTMFGFKTDEMYNSMMDIFFIIPLMKTIQK